MIINLYKYRTALALACLSLTALLLLYFLLPKLSSEEHSAQPEDALLHGEFLDWPEVNGLFPKYSKVTVIEPDSGLQFMVQRRGGTYHADVQPLTAGDTQIMKEIYHQGWSWKRKAVIVQLADGRRIAASMNGMPHGLGNIPDNQFDGHFCIHFKDSKTHVSSTVDPAHQLMIWKAAGLLDQQIKQLEARETVAVFLAAIDQGEINIAGRMLDFCNSLLLLNLANIEDIKAYDITAVDEDTFGVNTRIKYRNSSSSYYNKNFQLDTVKLNSVWKIESATLSDLLTAECIEGEKGNFQVWEEDLEADSL